MSTAHGFDNVAPNATRSTAGHGVDEKTLTYPDGTQIVQRFTNGPSTDGPVASVTVSYPALRSIEGHVVDDGRFWRVSFPALGRDIGVRFLQQAPQVAIGFLSHELQLRRDLIDLTLLRDGKPLIPPATEKPEPPPAPTVTYG